MARPLSNFALSFVFATMGVACVGSLDSTEPGMNPDNPADPSDPKDDIGGADAAPEIREYSLSVPPDLGSTELGQELSFTATVASDNFAGDVELALIGAMPSWVVTYDPAATVNLGLDESVDVNITIQIPTNGEPSTAPLQVSANSELGPRTGTANLVVENRVTLTIIDGAGAGGHGIGGNIAIKTGTQVVIENGDSQNHRIHADPHQGGSMSQGETYALSYEFAGTEYAYCHDHGENTGLIAMAVED